MLTIVARGYRGRAVATLSSQTPVFVDTTKRTMADVEVEHARAQWKTYGNLDSYIPGKHHILTFNKISPIGLKQFPSSSYEIFSSGGDASESTKSNAHAILLRSHKLQESEVAHTVRAIARYA
jgi:D-3-phosphoglycerate dehydrogenase / 2-oxoglutarate reductase